jgi:hypothetical protein
MDYELGRMWNKSIMAELRSQWSCTYILPLIMNKEKYVRVDRSTVGLVTIRVFQCLLTETKSG